MHSSISELLHEPVDVKRYNQLEDCGGVKMYLITVATKPNENLEKLKAMCNTAGVQIHVLGMNDLRPQGFQYGFGLKMYYLEQLCGQIVQYDSNALFIFIDAYDVMLVQSLQRLYNQYKLFQSDLVYSGEMFCNPDPSRITSFVDRHSQTYPFLNSGTFCGRVETIYHLLTTHPYDIKTDDQRYYQTLFLQYQHVAGLQEKSMFKLDTDATIFMCMAGTHLDITLNDNGDFTNVRTGSLPTLIHFNGCVELLPEMYKLWQIIQERRRRHPKSKRTRELTPPQLMKQLRSVVIVHPDKFYAVDTCKEIVPPSDAFCHCSNWNPACHGRKTWVECSGCQLWYHDYCYHISSIYCIYFDKKWYCTQCIKQ